MRSAKRIVEIRLSAQWLLLMLAVVAVLVFARQTAATSQNSLAVVSAASYRGDVLAAEQIVVAFGSNLADAIAVANTLPLPTTLSGVSVKVRDSQNVERLAPLFFISPTQINFQIPAGTANGATSFTVVKNNVTMSTGNAPVAAVAPSLFSADASGRGLAAGQALRIKANNAQSYEPIGQFDAQQGKFVPVQVDLGPATDQVFLIVYGSGFRNRKDLASVVATIGGVSAEVIFAGAQGGFAGLDQLNIRIPRSLPGGEFDVAVTVEGKAANVVRLALKATPLADVMYMASLRAEGSAFSPASGYATFRLSGDEKSGVLKFAYSNLTTPETSAHIHGPADPGQNGGILFDLDTSPRLADGSYVWQFTNIGAVTVPQIVGALKTGRLYINIHSSRFPAGEIRGHFGLINGSQAFTPPPAAPPLPSGTPTLRDASRFLAQASFGPKNSEITALQTKGFNTWMNEQFAMPQNSHLAYLDATIGTRTDYYQQEIMESFWKQAVTAPDQLRQRVIFALSQILVVSLRSNLDAEPFALAGYLDLLGKDAFGNFRQLLEDVTLSPAMGRYLDHLQNDKEDPATGRNPNENYAREVLQLFSIGLYKLHPDGTLKLDANGLPAATYDNDVVKGFAHVFTGWSYGSFSKTEQNWLYPNVYRNGTQQYWRLPMQAWPNHHSTLQKKLLDGVTLPANQTPEKDLKDALDNIFNHPNVGPYISRLLIQRLVTSNPSPAYVYRVAQQFNNNGSGVRGDMKAVIRAILMDYEARSLDMLANQGFGKMREPIVRFAHLLRVGNFACVCGTFPIYWMDSPEDSLGQNPLRAQSVFNFFEPTFSHPGHIASAGLHSPEFQITNETSIIGISDFFHYVIRDGFRWEQTKPLIPNYSEMTALAGNPRQLIDYLDLVMTNGGMSATLKAQLLTSLTGMNPNEPVKRVTMALHLVMTSPDYVIQK